MAAMARMRSETRRFIPALLSGEERRRKEGVPRAPKRLRASVVANTGPQNSLSRVRGRDLFVAAAFAAARSLLRAGEQFASVLELDADAIHRRRAILREVAVDD